VHCSGWALLGEVDKFVRVSPVRFTAVAEVGGFAAWVEGAPREAVRVAFLAPGEGGGLEAARVRVVVVAFGEGGGTAKVVCTGVGAAAACRYSLVAVY
jgi:hypothetical protein